MVRPRVKPAMTPPVVILDLTRDLVRPAPKPLAMGEGGIAAANRGGPPSGRRPGRPWS
jgi:hypothetical protein